jgi:hypothetical protein
MEPIFTELAGDTVTPELRAQLDAAVAALPPAHCLDPTENEHTSSRDAAFVRLQDWAFTKGFALVTESSKTRNGQVARVYLVCVSCRIWMLMKISFQITPLRLALQRKLMTMR